MNVPGGWELVLILVVVVLLFGTKRLPDASRSLGRSLRIFKAETKGLISDDDDEPATRTTPRGSAPANREPVREVTGGPVETRGYDGREISGERTSDGRGHQAHRDGDYDAQPARRARVTDDR